MRYDNIIPFMYQRYAIKLPSIYVRAIRQYNTIYVPTICDKTTIDIRTVYEQNDHEYIFGTVAVKFVVGFWNRVYYLCTLFVLKGEDRG